VQNTVLQLSELSLIAQRASGAQGDGPGGDGPYWERTLQHYMLALVLLLVTAREPVTIARMAEIGASAPLSPAQFSNRDWMRDSPLGQLLGRLAEEYPDERDPERRADIDLIFQFWTQWSALDGKPRGIVEGMWKTLSTHFLMNPLRSVFASGKSTTTPDDVLLKNRIVIVDYPIQAFKASGAIASQIWLYNIQKAIMRRSGPRGTLHPCAIIADECQYYVGPSSAEFASVARSSGGAIVYLTQTINSLRRVLGKETTDVLCSNLRTKFFAQCDGETAQFASSLCGSRYVWVNSTSDSGSTNHDEGGGISGGGGTTGMSRHQELRPFLLPSLLQTLRDGGALNAYEIDTCVMSGGRNFRGENGERMPFKVLSFRQRR
jgi:type IV secretory pathway TraG/TraD family ATPase VirD4